MGRRRLPARGGRRPAPGGRGRGRRAAAAAIKDDAPSPPAWQLGEPDFVVPHPAAGRARHRRGGLPLHRLRLRRPARHVAPLPPSRGPGNAEGGPPHHRPHPKYPASLRRARSRSRSCSRRGCRAWRRASARRARGCSCRRARSSTSRSTTRPTASRADRPQRGRAVPGEGDAEDAARTCALRTPRDLDIPPGDADAQHTATYFFKKDAIALRRVAAHAPARQVVQVRADDARRQARDAAVGAQLRLQLADQLPPGRAAAGAGGVVDAVHAAPSTTPPNNPHNPDPTARVAWGPQTYNEMFMGFMDMADVPGK